MPLGQNLIEVRCSSNKHQYKLRNYDPLAREDEAGDRTPKTRRTFRLLDELFRCR